MLSVITALEFFQHHFAKMGHRNTSCDPHLHQAIEHPMLPTSREASAAGRLRPNALIVHVGTGTNFSRFPDKSGAKLQTIEGEPDAHAKVRPSIAVSRCPPLRGRV